MDDRIQLVFSWDPRGQIWLKERGPENAAKPPAKPLDDGAVQTYFLDPQSGRWEGTILGARARTIGNELGTYYRSPGIVGLAVEDYEDPNDRLKVEAAQRKPVMPFGVVAGIVIALVVGAGAVASKTVFTVAGDTQSLASPATSNPPPSNAVQTAPQASTAPSAAPTEAPAQSAPQATAVRTPTVTTPPRTPAPTPPPQATTVILGTTLPTGYRIFYSGPNMAPQGSTIAIRVNVIDPNGEPYRWPIDVRIGNTGWTATATRLDGVYTASMPLIAPKGQQAIQLNVHFGAQVTVYTLGMMAVQ